ncbi:hypothetical protein [Salarchaeum japonicum]|uniref:hypothetical protein n=1 Tax=Salarchaeum japonicum TaxID=555573 RepID=UPI003C76FA9B
MAINCLVNVGSNSAGVTLPKDDLRELGLIAEDGSIESCSLRVESVGTGAWVVTATNEVGLDEFARLRAAASMSLLDEPGHEKQEAAVV